jgi:NAD(P)-dependent dehydrogenase (short-subunit alcohol dehydrogenase family)
VFSLASKTAVVTGGGSGIGESIAVLFGKQGARIAVLDVALDRAERTAARIHEAGGSARAIACDVGSQSSVEAAFARIDAEFGGVQILINNAGIAHIGSLLTTTEADFDRTYRVNVKGAFLVAQAAVKRMVAPGAGGGAIVNLASIASLVGLEDRFAYSMTKGAVLTMTRSIAVDYMKQGVRCNCLCPARIHTPFVDKFLADSYPGREAEMFDRLSKAQPIGRMGKPEEVAAFALYLCSDEAAFVTGAAFPIDGGVTAV